jgi:16S rRNA (cytosine1402-N4)-methyltransferase
MVAEVLEYLDCRPGGIYVDATFGGGGHTAAILEASSPDGQVIGLDRDREVLTMAEDFVQKHGGRVTLRHENFRNLERILVELDCPKVDGVLFDLGISSWQIDSPERGFSFRSDAVLDMRMDRDEEATADRLIRRSTEKELADIIWTFGEERRSRRVARIVKEAAAAHRPLTTTLLADAVMDALGAKGPRRGRIHPATRTFQALRIAVNRELDALEEALQQVPRVLVPGGRCCCIAYHSLEDRIVKNAFRNLSGRGPGGGESLVQVLTRKPLRPSVKEQRENPRARSARFRAARLKEAA